MPDLSQRGFDMISLGILDIEVFYEREGSPTGCGVDGGQEAGEVGSHDRFV
jgi:hypothetical protein